MSEFTYYLPGIIFGVLAGAALIWGILIVRELFLRSHGKAVCMYCKAAAAVLVTPQYLFRLPVSFGARYEDPEQYLLSHMRPILSKKQIPTGQRACRVEVCRCGRCQKQQVVITDFLQVRGGESVKSTYVFPLETFQPLLRQWDAIGGPPRADR